MALPATNLVLGKDALKVILYQTLDNGATWTNKETYVTNPILSSQLLQQTWTFKLYTTYTQNTAATFSFGSLS